MCNRNSTTHPAIYALSLCRYLVSYLVVSIQHSSVIVCNRPVYLKVSLIVLNPLYLAKICPSLADLWIDSFDCQSYLVNLSYLYGKVNICCVFIMCGSAESVSHSSCQVNLFVLGSGSTLVGTRHGLGDNQGCMIRDQNHDRGWNDLSFVPTSY